MHTLVKCISILDRPPSSDHLPLAIDFNIVLSGNIPFTNIKYSEKKVINWSDASRISLIRNLQRILC